jgi:D-lactate dehydrogenase
LRFKIISIIMKVLVYSARPYDRAALTEVSRGHHELVFTEKRLNIDSAAEAQGFEAVALFTADDASALVLQKLYDLGVRFIALRSAGHDHVDLAKAAQLGMHVANVPAYSPYAIAEHAVALLLAWNRKIVTSQLLMALQDFRLDHLTGFDIHGKTVGIIGTGNIGMAFMRIMTGFGSRILAYDPVPNEEAIRAGISYVSLDELIQRSDVISIHCPLTPQTRNLFSKHQFTFMKQEAVIINTSRGAVINTVDLIEALEKKQIAGACLDVYEFEKGLFFSDHSRDILSDALFARLRSFKNVLITGHQAFLTKEALQGIAETTMLNLTNWAAGVASPNELVNENKEANLQTSR